VSSHVWNCGVQSLSYTRTCVRVFARARGTQRGWMLATITSFASFVARRWPAARVACMTNVIINSALYRAHYISRPVDYGKCNAAEMHRVPPLPSFLHSLVLSSQTRPTRIIDGFTLRLSWAFCFLLSLLSQERPENVIPPGPDSAEGATMFKNNPRRESSTRDVTQSLKKEHYACVKFQSACK